jgi:hypothetical protein
MKISNNNLSFLSVGQLELEWLAEQWTNDPKFEGLNSAAAGT